MAHYSWPISIVLLVFMVHSVSPVAISGDSRWTIMVAQGGELVAFDVAQVLAARTSTASAGSLRSVQRRGLRNYAILLLLARLGLRACEIVAMTLDDIDWEAGHLMVRGKGGQRVKMLLPAEVGRASGAP